MSRLSDAMLRRAAWAPSLLLGAMIVAGLVISFVEQPVARQPVCDNYVRYALLVDPGALPAADVVAALGEGLWVPAVGLMGGFLFLLFPDGHLPSRRWRLVGWVSAVTMAVAYLGVTLRPGRLTTPTVVDNPLALPLHGSGVRRRDVRLRRALSWLGALETVTVSSFVLMPIAIGLALLRYRLYDLDLVVNRTLVYGLLTALAAVYLVSVLLLQLVLSPLTDQSDLAVAASTLAAAAIFRPARARIQALVDRRFFRRRYDAARTLDDFAAGLRHEVDLEAVSADLTSAVRDTVAPAYASVWLRS